MMEFIKKLMVDSPRYGRDEYKAARIIINELEFFKIPYKEEFFETAVPRIKKAELFADGQKIECIGSSLRSGEIEDGQYLISSLGFSGGKRPYNIAYSPITDEISVVDFYDEPSVTISRNSVLKIAMAKKVHGIVEVEIEKFTAGNTLVGNITDPEHVVFAHYDSIIGDGASDNAGSVAVLMQIVQDDPELLNSTLFVFAGNEEISYDNYKSRSGYGYRVFEDGHQEMLRSAKKVIVLDGIGVGQPEFVQTGLEWVLQLKMLDEIKDKTYWLQNDQSEVLKYFHTKADTISILDETFLKKAKEALVESLYTSVPVI